MDPPWCTRTDCLRALTTDDRLVATRCRRHNVIFDAIHTHITAPALLEQSLVVFVSPLRRALANGHTQSTGASASALATAHEYT